jgi:hypothetical protein
MERTDPALAGEGAVLLLEKLSPAVSDIDSSSGALGNATAAVVEKMAPLIAAAPVSRRVREKWLERLLDAIEEDDPPYITFNFLGFTFICGRSRRGAFLLRRHTRRDRMRAACGSSRTRCGDDATQA